MRFLTSVNSQMLCLLTWCLEWQGALSTVKGFLYSVSSHTYVASNWIAVRMTLNIRNNWRVSLQCELFYDLSGFVALWMTWNIQNNWRVFSLVWTLICIFRSDSCENGFIHSVQFKGFSPVWTLIWSFRLDSFVNDCKHSEQVKDFSPVKTLINFLWPDSCMALTFDWLGLTLQEFTTAYSLFLKTKIAFIKSPLLNYLASQFIF